MDKGRVNFWRCPECHGLTVAVHADAGVTPMFLGCRATPACKGTAESGMYPPPPTPPDIVRRIEWEWFMPSRRALRRMSTAMREHCAAGGLDIRPLTDAGRAALGGELTAGQDDAMRWLPGGGVGEVTDGV